MQNNILKAIDLQKVPDSVTILQNKAVENLINEIALKDEITFKAPTGSGKTRMMADMMNRILSTRDDIIFLVSALSKGDLAEQIYNSFKEYNEYIFQNINPYLISSETSGENGVYIPTNYNVYVLPRDLYKDKSKLKQGALHNFLHQITSNKYGLGKKIYVIKDECHQATNNLDSLSDVFFKKIINVSATPKLNKNNPDVLITEEEAIEANLIKRVINGNEKDTLDDALSVFNKLKKDYDKLLGINPCMIIQISNQSKAEEEIKDIKHSLNKFKDLKWMLIVNDDKQCDTNDFFKVKKLPVKKWKDYAKLNNSTIDVIIFKMVITEGWDIPRACMLYQIRDSHSKQLDEQVMGRVRRNPCLKGFEHLPFEARKLCTSAYIWGILPKKKSAMISVSLAGNNVDNEIHRELKIKTTKLKRLEEDRIVDTKKLLDNTKKERLIPSSIFDLYHKYISTNNEVLKLYNSYVSDYESWFDFMENVSTLEKEIKNFNCNYKDNMVLVKDDYGNIKEISFPMNSYFKDTIHSLAIDNWVWERNDNKFNFSFDSSAEEEWTEILISLTKSLDDIEINQSVIKKIDLFKMVENNDGELIFQNINKYMFGKNYLTNSEIKFEYYLNGIHSSYPDFILKDYKEQIHIFEVKSVNYSNNIHVDKNEYEEKANELIRAYKQASILTGYCFYLPVKMDNIWKIHYIKNGNESLISLDVFKKIILK